MFWMRSCVAGWLDRKLSPLSHLLDQVPKKLVIPLGSYPTFGTVFTAKASAWRWRRGRTGSGKAIRDAGQQVGGLRRLPASQRPPPAPSCCAIQVPRWRQ
jgi:hypothetical protein